MAWIYFVPVAIILSGFQLSIQNLYFRQPKIKNIKDPKLSCKKNNGNCSHLCLITSNDSGYQCACPHLMKLGEDQKTCIPNEKFLIMSRKNEIRGLDFNNHNLIPPLSLPKIGSPLGLDFDAKLKKIYFFDSKQKKVYVLTYYLRSITWIYSKTILLFLWKKFCILLLQFSKPGIILHSVFDQCPRHVISPFDHDEIWMLNSVFFSNAQNKERNENKCSIFNIQSSS